MLVDISTIDPSDEVTLRAAYDVEKKAKQVGREDAPYWSFPDMRSMYTHPDPGEEMHAFVGRVDGRVVAYGVVWLPLHDNLEKAWGDVSVDPDHQGRGLGRTMLERVLDVVRDAGRTLFDNAAPSTEKTTGMTRFINTPNAMPS